MKHLSLILALALVFASGCKSGNKAEKAEEQKETAKVEQQLEAKIELGTTMEKVSYAIGMDIGRNLSANGMDDINPEILASGLTASFKGQKTLLTEDQVKEVLDSFRKEMMAKQQEEANKALEVNLKAGQEFLAKNKERKEVTTLPSGLQYEIIKEGEGNAPGKDDFVQVDYNGTLIDGTEFDSSYKRGKPATFPVGGVIKGWTEALMLMKPGAKWKLYVPADLAYGARQAGPKIAPNSALVFEVELHKVMDKQVHKPTAADAAKAAAAKAKEATPKVEVKE